MKQLFKFMTSGAANARIKELSAKLPEHEVKRVLGEYFGKPVLKMALSNQFIEELEKIPEAGKVPSVETKPATAPPPAAPKVAPPPAPAAPAAPPQPATRLSLREAIIADLKADDVRRSVKPSFDPKPTALVTSEESAEERPSRSLCEQIIVICDPAHAPCPTSFSDDDVWAECCRSLFAAHCRVKGMPSDKALAATFWRTGDVEGMARSIRYTKQQRIAQLLLAGK